MKQSVFKYLSNPKHNVMISIMKNNVDIFEYGNSNLNMS